jgi:hypothetical protein
VFVPQSHAIIKGEGDIESFVQGLFDTNITAHKLEFIEVVASDAQMIHDSRTEQRMMGLYPKFYKNSRMEV